MRRVRSAARATTNTTRSEERARKETTAIFSRAKTLGRVVPSAERFKQPTATMGVQGVDRGEKSSASVSFSARRFEDRKLRALRVGNHRHAADSFHRHRRKIEIGAHL